jgi:capsid protein
MKTRFLERMKLAYKVAIGEVSKRYFDGASSDRLKSDWGTTVTSADAELRNDLGALRSRWRELERNNDYGARFLSLLENNVIGADGIDLHMHILDPSGKLDSKACAANHRGGVEQMVQKNKLHDFRFVFDG